MDANKTPTACPFVVDEARWPLVLVQVPPVAVENDDWAKLIAILDGLYLRGPFAVVYDAPTFVVPTATQRRLLANGIVRHEALHPGKMMSIAIATQTRSLATSLIRVLSWLAPQRQPRRIFTDLDVAIAWTHERIAEAAAGTPSKQRSGHPW